MKRFLLIGLMAAFSMTVMMPDAVYGQNAAADKEAVRKEKEK